MKNVLAVAATVGLSLAARNRLTVSTITRGEFDYFDDVSAAFAQRNMEWVLHSEVPDEWLQLTLGNFERVGSRVQNLSSADGVRYLVLQLDVADWRHEVLMPMASHDVRLCMMYAGLQRELCVLLKSARSSAGCALRVPINLDELPPDIYRAPLKSHLRKYFQAAVMFAATRALDGPRQAGGLEGLNISVSILIPREVEVELFTGLSD